MRDATSALDFLVLPGLANSGVDHWQSYWCLSFRNATRVLQDDWDSPKRDSWLERLDATIEGGSRPVILICHSLSCTLAAHWAARARPGRVRAAFLVAPSDLERPGAPIATRDFLPIPLEPFPVPSLVVASTDDLHVSPARAREFAKAWHADYCELPELGHINSVSRLGFWPQGMLLLGQLIERIKI
ncbi:MAG TPA: alpha/beta hydrolase [Pseudolabrys sp.]|nr:alpha/beta hydrolase [Pseudolabrys sp.]